MISRQFGLLKGGPPTHEINIGEFQKTSNQFTVAIVVLMAERICV